MVYTTFKIVICLNTKSIWLGYYTTFKIVYYYLTDITKYQCYATQHYLDAWCMLYL